MPHLTPPTVVVSGTKILAAKYNADIQGLVTGVNASAQFLDVAATNSAANTWSALQTMSGGLSVTGGTLAVTGNATVGGTLGVTSNVTIGGTLGVTGTITGNVTGNLTGNVTGNLTGNVTGNVSGTSGSTTGNAATATALQTGRTINGVTFDGTGNITVAAAAGTLTGATLASGVTASSLTSLGTQAANLIFLDNTYDIGASGATRPRTGYFGTSVVTPLLNNSGSTITLRGVTYTLPSADGTSGQVLQTNGSAVLSWAAASSGFVTGSGTTGKIPKWSSASGMTDSVIAESSGVITITGTLVVTGSALTFGSNPATSGAIRIGNNLSIYARNASNSGNAQIIGLDGSDRILIGSDGGAGQLLLGSGTGTILIGTALLRWPTSDGTTGQFLSTNGSGVLSFATAGGVSGLTTGKLPKAASSTGLTDSLLAESGTTLTASADFTLSGTHVLTVGGAATVGGTLGVTGAVTMSSTLGVTSNATVGGTLGVTGLLTASGNCLVSGTFTVGGNVNLNGNTTIGDASSDTLTVTATVVSSLLPTNATYNLGGASNKWNIAYLFDHLDIGGNQVVASRDTGYSPTWNAVYAASKTASLGPLATPANLGQCAAAVDITALGQMVHAMYNSMVSHGLIGA